MEKLVVGITGSRGFIGKNLVEHLSQDSDIQIAPFTGDILNEEDLDLYFQNNSDLTHFVHLAGIATVNESFRKLFDVNVTGTANVLNMLNKNNLKPRFIFASSYAVYGAPLNGESSIETDIPNPDSYYGLSKKFGEDLIQFNSENYILARLPSLYGKYSVDGVIARFIASINSKGFISLNGDGKQVRNFSHVEDICEFIRVALKSSKVGVFNVSDGVRVTLLDIIELLKSKYSFEVKHTPANNPSKNLSLNPDKLINTFNFEFKHKSIEI